MDIAESVLQLKKDQIETPALLVNVPIMEANLDRMAAYFCERHAKLRPHVKTHKTPILAHKQLAAGSAVGVTTAKLGEAEVMVRGGIRDVLIANEIVQPSKIARLVGLARHADVKVAVDSLANIEQLAAAAAAYGTRLGVLVEVNVGLNRCGVEPGSAALALARAILRCPSLVFEGLQGYEGHVVLRPDPEERRRRGREAMEKLVGTRRLLERNGITVAIVSGGGSGTYNVTGDFDGVDEVQAGSYIFMDAHYQETGIEFGQALTLLATVISRPSSETAILDAGLKAVSSDFDLPRVKDHPEWRVTALHEEHSIMSVPGGDAGLRVGDTVELVPGHGCTTINLHDYYYALRDDRVEAVWPIEARGRFR